MTADKSFWCGCVILVGVIGGGSTISHVGPVNPHRANVVFSPEHPKSTQVVRHAPYQRKNEHISH